MQPQNTYYINYEHDGRMRRLFYTASNEEKANAMFQSIKGKGLFGGERIPNQSMHENLKKKILASFDGKHDCSIRSLLLVMPELDYEKVRDFFLKWTDKHPYGGVTTRDFNLVLRIMKIFDKFEHGKPNGEKTIWDFIEDEENTYILLLENHFTVVSDGRIVDFLSINPLNDEKVFSSWKLKKQQ